SLSILFFSAIFPHFHSSTLFPYTTLFRSGIGVACAHDLGSWNSVCPRCGQVDCSCLAEATAAVASARHEQSTCPHRGHTEFHDRSEEHTSELQSRFDLVCRLLLEKKKKKR